MRLICISAAIIILFVNETRIKSRLRSLSYDTNIILSFLQTGGVALLSKETFHFTEMHLNDYQIHKLPTVTQYVYTNS